MTTVHQLVEAPLLRAHVTPPTAEQSMPVPEVVADTDRGDLLDQTSVQLFEVHQFREQSAHCLGPRLEGQQLDLRAGVVQHGGGHRVPFGW
jgi:hypothetical protein